MRRQCIFPDATLRVYAEIDWAAPHNPEPPPFHCNPDLSAKLTSQAFRAGVMLSAGTDGMTPREAPNSALHEELELLATRAGMPPLHVIRSATLIGAMTIGKAGEMGTVEAGKLANLVVLERNPLDDLGNLRSVVFTVKRGRRFDRADYRPISPEEIPDDE